MLLMRDREGFQAVLQTMAESKHPVVARTATGFSQKENKERSAVISTTQGNTEAFDNPQLLAVTNKSTFRLKDLKDQVASLYLIVPPEHEATYQPFLLLVIGVACAAITRNRRLPRHQVLFLLNELPALGNIAPIENGIVYLAGYGVSLWLFWQDLD